MKKRSTIDQWSLLWELVRLLWARPIYNFYFRKIKIVNAGVIHRGEPVILAPNHQNALMDALAIVAGIKYQTVFLARADIFKGGLVDQILKFLKILPIYRIRDGISSLQKNDEIFDITVNVLHNRINPLLLFPEGNHGDKHRLRPLVKGIFRIAFKTQEEFKSNPGVKIIPVGIDYSHYWKFRQTQLIVFGQPIEVNTFWKTYEENNSTAINELREKLADEMKKYMIHIETEEYYDVYMGLRLVYRKTMCRKMGLKTGDLYDEFLADKKLIECLDIELTKNEKNLIELKSVYNDYSRVRDILKFRDWVASKHRYSIAGNVLALLISVFVWPLVLLGLFNNWPHFFIPVRFTKGIKDTQFFSTAKWGAGFVLIIIYFLILGILALIFLPLWWIKILYILTLPSSGIFALAYRRFIIKSWAKIRYSASVKKRSSQTATFKALYDKLLQLTDKIVDEKLTAGQN